MCGRGGGAGTRAPGGGHRLRGAWPNGDLRPSLEDYIGAGAVLAHLDGNPSPEAVAAIAVFETTKSHLPDTLRACASGKELIEWGFEDDIEIAVRLNSDDVAPRLRNRAFVDDAA